MLPNRTNLNSLAIELSNRYFELFNERIPNYKLTKLMVLIFDLIAENVSAGNQVSVKNFGTFDAYLYKERYRIDPVLKKEHFISTRLIPKFTSSSKFKKQLSNNTELLQNILNENEIIS